MGVSVLFRRGILSESFILIVGRSEVGKKVGVDEVVQFILDEAFVTSVPFHVMLTPSVGNNGLGGWVGTHVKFDVFAGVRHLNILFLVSS